MATIGPTSNIYFSQRLKLHYADWGNESAPPLLLVHGSLDHCRNWDWVARAVRQDYRIIAPDLRGHGDSQWQIGSSYQMLDYVYDIAQLVEQKKLAPVRIISHSLGAAISLNYAGIFPEHVSKLVAIEGLGPPQAMIDERARLTAQEIAHQWIQSTRKLAGRQVKRYPSLSGAIQRMQAANPHLSEEQAKHLTAHGSYQNEDGSYSWKFDNYVRNISPGGFHMEESQKLLGQITCPVLLFRGADSWASDPIKDGRTKQLKNARLETIANAGHWVHHDQLSTFLDLTLDFLQE